MKNIEFKIVSPHFSHVFCVLINKMYHYYYVLADRDMEESGVWQCNVFIRHFLACGNVEVMEHVHSERVFRSSKSPSCSVAREVLRHYLYDTFSNDDLPF